MRSAVFDSRSKRAVAMLVSSSEGLWREGLVAAILLRALMVAVVVDGRIENGGAKFKRGYSSVWAAGRR